MSVLFPRFTVTPVTRCGGYRHGGSAYRSEIAPLFSLFDDTFAELQRASRHSRGQFNPRFDLKETKEGYSLEGELPGIDQKDVSIEFTDEHTLTIKGRSERHVESGKKPETSAALQQNLEESSPQASKSHQATVEDEEPANSYAVAPPTTNTEAETETAQAAGPTKPESEYWFTERSIGEFSRSFNFPARVNQDAVKASLRNGILSIVVPKAAVPESRRINIE